MRIYHVATRLKNDHLDNSIRFCGNEVRSRQIVTSQKFNQSRERSHIFTFWYGEINIRGNRDVTING